MRGAGKKGGQHNSYTVNIAILHLNSDMPKQVKGCSPVSIVYHAIGALAYMWYLLFSVQNLNAMEITCFLRPHVLKGIYDMKYIQQWARSVPLIVIYSKA